MVEPEPGLDPMVELEGLVEAEVDAVGVSVGGRAEDEDVVVELPVFFVEVALSEGSAVPETLLAADGARGLEEVGGDGS